MQHSFFKSSRLGSGHVAKRALLAAAMSCLTLGLGACTVTAGASGSGSTGSGNLVVNWTLNSSSDPSQCSQQGAQNISLSVLDTDGLEVGSTTTTCSSLSSTFVGLNAGNYTVNATLLDANGGALASAASTTSVNGSATTTDNVDFSAASFTTPVAGTGTLELDWTLASSADASQCATYSAKTISIQVFDASNQQYGAATSVPCSALSASIVGLPAGNYAVSAQMLDANGDSVSTILGPVNEIVSNGAVTTQAIDFPDSSFVAPTSDAGDGSLTVTWTVAGKSSDSACSDADASNMRLALFDDSNTQVGSTDKVDCNAFDALLDSVAPGTYTLTAKLVDANGDDATTTVTVPGIVITADQSTAQPIDFPSTSFLSGADSGTGSIAVTWTVEGDSQVASCGNHNAASIALQLYEADGITPIGAPILDPCTAFAATIANLTPGQYNLSAQLVNAVDTVSTLVPPQPITVQADGAAPLAFEFPANAF